MEDNTESIDTGDENLVAICRAAIDESGKTDWEIVSAMGITDRGNGSKKIKDGSLISKTRDIFKLYELTQSQTLRAYIARKIGVSLQYHDAAAEVEREKNKADRYKGALKDLMEIKAKEQAAYHSMISKLIDAEDENSEE